VFTAVMTGHLVILGASLGRVGVPDLTRAAIAVGAYVAGVAVASRLARRVREERERAWPARVSALLCAEATLQLAMFAWWFAVDGRPSSHAIDGLLALSAGAMGVQASAVQVLRAPDVSTTYLTGTLTTLVRRLSSDDAHGSLGAATRQAGVLIGMVGGAATAAAVLGSARSLAPALSPAGVLLVVVLASTSNGLRRSEPRQG
jgi:uncharacterized membrane protein YoaK (UPF0700 family)